MARKRRPTRLGGSAYIQNWNLPGLDNLIQELISAGIKEVLTYIFSEKDDYLDTWLHTRKGKLQVCSEIRLDGHDVDHPHWSVGLEQLVVDEAEYGDDDHTLAAELRRLADEVDKINAEKDDAVLSGEEDDRD